MEALTITTTEARAVSSQFTLIIIAVAVENINTLEVLTNVISVVVLV
jgi:hypothetical protein